MFLESNLKKFYLQFITKSNTLSLPSWNWNISFHVTTFSLNEELKIQFTGIDIDHTNRSIEYLLMIVNEKRVLRMITGTKMFTKLRLFFNFNFTSKSLFFKSLNLFLVFKYHYLTIYKLPQKLPIPNIKLPQKSYYK